MNLRQLRKLQKLRNPTNVRPTISPIQRATILAQQSPTAVDELELTWIPECTLHCSMPIPHLLVYTVRNYTRREYLP